MATRLAAADVEAGLLALLNTIPEIVDSHSFASCLGVPHKELEDVIKRLSACRIVESSDITKETWVLTDEAKGYAARGSPEVQLVAAIPPEGASKGALKGVASKVIDDLKKRKLVTKEKTIWYSLKKGPEFVLKRKTLATDVTREHLKSYRSSTLFDGIEEGGIHISAYSSHEIDEHENERASDLASILEREPSCSFERTSLPVLPPDLLPHPPGNMETSLNQTEIDMLCKSFPDDIVASTHWEPGSILIYEDTMHGGFTLPLHPFAAKILNEFGISPAQLRKHGWLAIQTFLTQCDEKQLKPSIDSFSYFFRIFKVSPKDPDRDHYTFRSLVGDIMKVPEAKERRERRHTKMEWHERFFFITSKSSARWLFPEKWARGGPLTKKCQLTEGDQEVVKALGGNPSADQCLSPVLAPTPALGSSLPKEVDDQEVVKAVGGDPIADQCLSPVPAPTAALGSSLPKEVGSSSPIQQGIEKLISKHEKQMEELKMKYEKQIEELKMVCNSTAQELGRLKMERRDLFLAVARILKDQKGISKEYFNFLNKYLATFDGSSDDSNVIGEAKEEAAAAIIEFVKSSDLYQCDLLDMPAVAQLEKDEKYQSVYELLKIFLTQRLNSYLEFQSANSTLLQGYGLVHEDCITKIRLMSLLDLSSHCSGEIPYSAITKALGINDDEVEYWIVKAISSKILDCKVDQLNQLVIFSRHTERIFGNTTMEESMLKAWSLEGKYRKCCQHCPS